MTLKFLYGLGSASNMRRQFDGPFDDDDDGGFPGGGINFPLTPIEKQARTHALLCAIGFLVLLPLGSLIARYTRTFTRHWFYPHVFIQLVVSAPVIFLGWSKGYDLADELHIPHFSDPHQKMAIALLIMYVIQLGIGVFIHFFKIPTLGAGRRPFQNYIHALLGLAIVALAASQVHYGLYTEWDFALGGLHKIPSSAKHAWLALVIVFWALYAIGLVLLPRQMKQENRSRMKGDSQIPLSGNGNGNNGRNHAQDA